MKKIDIIIVITVAFLVSAFYYAPFLDNYFVWDDFWLLENYYTLSFINFLFGFADLRLFGNCILWLNCLISGFNPIGYSLISISGHIANSAMLLLLIYSLSGNRLLSIFTASIFAASVVGCDAIFWKDAFLTISGLFLYLLVLYLYLEGRKRQDRRFYYMALVVFLLAMFNKEEIATAPFMILFIEMLSYRDEEGLTSKLKRVLPYFIVIIIYVFLSLLISRYYVSQEQFDRFLSFRPFHSLFSGFSSFFISPKANLNWKDPIIYVTGLLVVLSLIFIKDRKFLWLGYGWAFLTFLPQSLTGTGYNPAYIFASISRHLYLPSVGPALVFSVILLAVKERLPRKVFVIITALFFSAFIFINHERVNARGKEWQDVGNTMEWFLYSLKIVQPSLPENSYVHVLRGPGGRSYVLRALRAVYKNPKIFWIDEPQKDAYIYVYLNGYVLNDHKQLLELAYAVTNEDIRYVARFYELKGLNREKLEMMRAISDSAYNDAEKHNSLALIYRDMKIWDEAESEFKSALSIKPYDVTIHYDLGMVYLAEEQYGQAINEFGFVVNADRNNKFPMAKGFIDYIKKQKSKG